MTSIENLTLIRRDEIKKEVAYKSSETPNGEMWAPLFCYDSGLPAKSFLQTHAHTEMKEGFCVERGAMVIVDETPEGAISEINLKEGDFYLVEEGHWHTIVNTTESEVNFLALGLVKKIGGVTIDK